MPEAATVLPPGDTGSQQQVYETDSSQEYFVKEEDGKVVEEVRDVQEQNNLYIAITLIQGQCDQRM